MRWFCRVVLSLILTALTAPVAPTPAAGEGSSSKPADIDDLSVW